jgi:uncharacterized membrane-anchored protein
MDRAMAEQEMGGLPAPAAAEPETRFEEHPLRGAVIGELHSRPPLPVETPRRILHYAFDTMGERAAADRVAFTEFCGRRGLAAPEPSTKYHRIVVGAATLSWEQHSEFTTYTWSLPSSEPGSVAAPFQPPAQDLGSFMRLVPPSGPVVVAIDLNVVANPPQPFEYDALFDASSLTLSKVADGLALVATDFKLDPAGFVRILVIDRGLDRRITGLLVQRLIEIETYRTFALLGLPEAQRLSPIISRVERTLMGVMERMRTSEDLPEHQALLDELTAIASELEATAASSSFRFGASRAYDGIVRERLESLGEQAVDGFPPLGGFLARRLKPAMRTCESVAARQSDLSGKLSRAANLLRTRVDVELEEQNRDLLVSMNDRTRMQLRLQQTVEGLSVAAICYYVVGLFGYLVKGAKEAGVLPVDPGIATAIFVPVALGGIWFAVRRIRRHTLRETRAAKAAQKL